MSPANISFDILSPFRVLEQQKGAERKRRLQNQLNVPSWGSLSSQISQRFVHRLLFSFKFLITAQIKTYSSPSWSWLRLLGTFITENGTCSKMDDGSGPPKYHQKPIDKYSNELLLSWQCWWHREGCDIFWGLLIVCTHFTEQLNNFLRKIRSSHKCFEGFLRISRERLPVQVSNQAAY